MKEFWYNSIEDYLEKSDHYDNPKTLKMFEMVNSDTPPLKILRAVTYLRTALIGWQMKINQDDYKAFKEKLEIHDHCLGVILEVGRLS